MSYKKRLFYLMIIDSIIVLSSIYISHFILAPRERPALLLVVSSTTLFVCYHFFASRYKLYKRVWQYASIGELLAIFKGVSFSCLMTAFTQLALFHVIYYRGLTITWMLYILLIGGLRFSWRLYRDSAKGDISNKKRTLIIGAGAGGAMVVRQLQLNPSAELYPVAFIDDDANKQRLQFLGLPVIGGREKIDDAVKDLDIENIVIAIPSLSKKELNLIVQECNKTRAKTQIVPMLEDLMTGKVSVSEFRDVQVEDLLGREQVELDTESISDYITGSVVLVTGAGGSIGSEVCRQITKFSPSTIILLGHGENSIYSIEMELKATN
jgi:FlaA1/EpsC-like NDP-sugar epimerase